MLGITVYYKEVWFKKNSFNTNCFLFLKTSEKPQNLIFSILPDACHCLQNSLIVFHNSIKSVKRLYFQTNFISEKSRLNLKRINSAV